MQARLVARTTIAATPAEVFMYLAHLKYHFLWNPHLQSVTPQVPLKLGTAYKSSSLLVGIRVNGRNVVTKFMPDRELELVNTTGPLVYRANYLLSTTGKETAVTCTTIVSSESQAFTFTAPVLKALGRRELQTDMKALKAVIEQKLG